MAAFEEVGLAPEIIKAVEEIGWTLPTPVQIEAVPLILGGGDVMAAAETGSGKTGAFALPVLQVVHEALRERLQPRKRPADGSARDGNGAKRANVACALSTQDRDLLLAVAADGLKCQSRSEHNWQGCRGTIGVFAGKVYYEVVVCDEGLCRIGWSTQSASLELGMDKSGFGYGGTGKKSNAKSFEDYGEAYGKGDVVGVMVDFDAGVIAFSVNGRHHGDAFRLPPQLQGQPLYPAICLKNAELEINFGATPFKHLPAGYVGLAAAPSDATTTRLDAAPAAAGGSRRQPSCIILEPSRDLAEQTHDCITQFKQYLVNPRIVNELIVGGANAKDQARALQEGVDIVTGTAGRIGDMVNSGKLLLDQVRFFVLDEADRLLDTGNFDDILKLYNRLPKQGSGAHRLQVLMFSATLHSQEVRDLAKKICQNPILVDLKGKEAVPETVDHVMVKVDPREDRSWLQSSPQVHTDNAHTCDRVGQPNLDTQENWSEAVKRLKPRMLKRVIDAFDMNQCLIFCRTNFDCDNLEKFFNALDGGGGGARSKGEFGIGGTYSCCVLAGARMLEDRRAALQAFKEGRVRFLICTDVAARGIDIKELPYVINVTLPDRSEDYIHRVGRVGRADTMGLAISLVSSVPEKVWYCTKKGYKPWFEPDSNNTKTHEHGGQTIWYNEPQLLQDIEKRLGQTIPSLKEDLSLPSAVAERLKTGGLQYGQQRTGGSTAEVEEHLDSIRQNVDLLAKLETDVQLSYFNLQQRWKAVA